MALHPHIPAGSLSAQQPVSHRGRYLLKTDLDESMDFGPVDRLNWPTARDNR